MINYHVLISDGFGVTPKTGQKTLNLFNDKALKLVCKFSVEIIIQCFVDIIQTSDENPKTQNPGQKPDLFATQPDPTPKNGIRTPTST